MRANPRPIRATLVHNPAAGPGQAGQDLAASLKQAGYEVNYLSAKTKNLGPQLDEPGELVIVAGGDGTVAKVAAALAGRLTPLAILPVGTANNIARSLGLVGGTRHIIEGLRTAPRKRLDVPVAHGPWGHRLFVEAAGVGLFARALALLDHHDAEAVSQLAKEEPTFESIVRLLRQLITDYSPREWSATLDGRNLSGRYLMLEAMNIRLIGPHLHLAPDADPGDGLFDVVLVSDAQCQDLLNYFGHRLEKETTVPELTVHRGRRLEFSWAEPEIHFDDDVWKRARRDSAGGRPSGPTEALPVVLEIGGQSVDVLVPGP